MLGGRLRRQLDSRLEGGDPQPVVARVGPVLRKIEDGLDASNPYALQSKPEPYNLGGSSNMSTQQIREAYRGLQGSGSMLDCMKNIGGILGTQRGAGFR